MYNSKFLTINIKDGRPLFLWQMKRFQKQKNLPEPIEHPGAASRLVVYGTDGLVDFDQIIEIAPDRNLGQTGDPG